MISPAVSAAKAARKLGVVADLVLHLPQGLDRVPVAVRGRVLEPAQELLVDLAVRLLHDRPQVQGRRQLGEVEHPVDLPVPVVDVDRVLEQAGQLGQAQLVRLVEPRLEEGEVALHLGAQAARATSRRSARRRPAGPRRGTCPIVVGVVGVARHARRRSGRCTPSRRSRRSASAGIGRRVDVAVDVLGEPVDRERRAEPAEHVVAAQPPAADVEEHRAERVRAVQVVVDPEEAPARPRRPSSTGNASSPRNWPEDLLRLRHGRGLLQSVCEEFALPDVEPRDGVVEDDVPDVGRRRVFAERLLGRVLLVEEDGASLGQGPVGAEGQAARLFARGVGDAAEEFANGLFLAGLGFPGGCDDV